MLKFLTNTLASSYLELPDLKMPSTRYRRDISSLFSSWNVITTLDFIFRFNLSANFFPTRIVLTLFDLKYSPSIILL